MARTKQQPRPYLGPTCIACCNALEPESTISVPCGCHWCLPCLTTHITLSLKDEQHYPPYCCTVRLLANTDILSSLPKDLLREMRARKLELETKNKTYCHRPSCSAFIAPHSIHQGEAICQKCRTRTCAKCKNAAHWGPCTYVEEAELLALAKAECWKRCPVCRRLVEREEGCDEMRCRCGTVFCYGCGTKGLNCPCTNEDMSEPDSDERPSPDPKAALVDAPRPRSAWSRPPRLAADAQSGAVPG